MPPPLPPETDRTDMQGVEDGVGPLMHRRYTTRVREAELDAEQLIAAFAGKPNRASPTALASFVKLRGERGRAARRRRVHRAHARPLGRAGARRSRSSPPASASSPSTAISRPGRIRFSAEDLGPGRLEIRIEAWARGGDRLSNLLFDRLPLNKEVQLHMWISVLEQLSELSGGRRDGPVDITTRRVDERELARAG